MTEKKRYRSLPLWIYDLFKKSGPSREQLDRGVFAVRGLNIHIEFESKEAWFECGTCRESLVSRGQGLEMKEGGIEIQCPGGAEHGYFSAHIRLD